MHTHTHSHYFIGKKGVFVYITIVENRTDDDVDIFMISHDLFTYYMKLPSQTEKVAR